MPMIILNIVNDRNANMCFSSYGTEEETQELNPSVWMEESHFLAEEQTAALHQRTYLLISSL